MKRSSTGGQGSWSPAWKPLEHIKPTRGSRRNETCNRFVHMSDLEAEEQPASRHAAAQKAPEALARASSSSNEQEHAAQIIQKHYRGYRERRQLQGMGLNAGARWSEVHSCFARAVRN